jgi:uncharacterized protein (TIGR03067 family)
MGPKDSTSGLGENKMQWQRFVFPLVGFLLMSSLSVANEPVSGDVKRLQGSWRFVALEANGEKKPAEETQGWKVIFKGDEMWVVKPEGTDPKLKFKLDPTKEPKTIDLIVQEGKDKGEVAPGIYAFSNGQLRLCINIFGDRSFRPREFKTQERDGVGFATLEQVKAE